MTYTPTVNLVSGRLVACYDFTCEIYQEGSWQHLQDTRVMRTHHSSATTQDAILLIGGGHSKSTEWIPVDGSPAQQGPFNVRHGSGHCTVQISDDVIVVTGGWETESYVTEYNLDQGNEIPLTSLGQPRRDHACGVYQDTSGQQASESICSWNQCCTPILNTGLFDFEILQNFFKWEGHLKQNINEFCLF